MQIGVDECTLALGVQAILIEIFGGFVVNGHGQIFVEFHGIGVEHLATVFGIGGGLPIVLFVVGEQCHPIRVGQLVGLCDCRRRG